MRARGEAGIRLCERRWLPRRWYQRCTGGRWCRGTRCPVVLGTWFSLDVLGRDGVEQLGALSSPTDLAFRVEGSGLLATRIPVISPRVPFTLHTADMSSTIWGKCRCVGSCRGDEWPEGERARPQGRRARLRRREAGAPSADPVPQMLSLHVSLHVLHVVSTR
jgi:hypothetical protein